jgi:predicted KAP-like P-loop ATPase
MILSDNETKVDLSNNEPIAKTIVALLRKHADQPVTIGVHGDWGAGKSSILEMIEAELSGDDKVLCLKFNGRRFQGFEDSKIALIEGIVTGLLERQGYVAAKWDASDSGRRRKYYRITKEGRATRRPAATVEGR